MMVHRRCICTSDQHIHTTINFRLQEYEAVKTAEEQFHVDYPTSRRACVTPHEQATSLLQTHSRAQELRRAEQEQPPTTPSSALGR